MVEKPSDGGEDYNELFRLSHQREFGFWLTKRRVIVDNIRVRSIGKNQTVHALPIEKSKEGETPKVMTTTPVYYAATSESNTSRCLSTPVYDLNDLKGGMVVSGPSIILNQTSTILVEPGCKAEIDNYGNVII